jgi:hypothetical protein
MQVLEQKLDFGPVTIQSVVPGGPADRDGKLKRGDKIFSIDGGAAFGCKLENVLGQLMGEEGTSVTIVALRFVPGSLFSTGTETKISSTLVLPPNSMSFFFHPPTPAHCLHQGPHRLHPSSGPSSALVLLTHLCRSCSCIFPPLHRFFCRVFPSAMEAAT